MNTRAPRQPGYLELASRIIDIVGLHLAPPARVLALELGTPQDRPVLPMDPGTAPLFDQLNAASRRPTAAHPAACHRFLTQLANTVPPDRDGYLVCLELPSALQDWLVAHPRFAASHPATTARWADEVTQCLGHRAARPLRRRTKALETDLRQWRRTGRDHTFTWVRPSPHPNAGPAHALPMPRTSQASR